MRKTVLTGLFACVAIAAVHSSAASAQAPDSLITNTLTPNTLTVVTVINPDNAVQTPKPEQKPEPVEHIIGPRETLSSVAEQYKTTWQRLFNKNVQIINPDQLIPGDNLIIPAVDEQLADRPLPEPPKVEQPAMVAAPVRATAKQQAPVVYTGGNSAGNTYAPGNCTWYAKSMRPDLPNNLGNADTWVYRAAAQGLTTGSAPEVGAIGQQGMHVVYVEAVNAGGTVSISEMNYQGLYVVSRRTVPASYFRYIY